MSRSLWANFSVRCKVNQTARLSEPRSNNVSPIFEIFELKNGKTALISGFGLLL